MKSIHEPLVDIHNTPSVNCDLMLMRELSQNGGKWCELAIGESSRVAVIGRSFIGDFAQPGDVSIAKVPRDDEVEQMFGRAEVETYQLLADVEPESPYEIPVVERVEETPFYFMLSYISGKTIRSPKELTLPEQRHLGSAIARMTMWEENIGVSAFSERIDAKFDKRWDWDSYYSSLDFSDRDLPSLSVVAGEMRLLQQRLYPNGLAASPEKQVIHGDLRLSNLKFKGTPGERRLHGIPDWGSARIGDRAEECRPLWKIGQEAILAANETFESEGRSAADPEAVRLWFIGRFVVSLIRQLQDGIPRPAAFVRTKAILASEYPDMSWDELPTVKVPPTNCEIDTGVPRFFPDFNHVYELQQLDAA